MSPNLRFVVPAVLTLIGCGGYAPDQMPGSSTFLLFGNIAVDPDTETSFVVDYEIVVREDGSTDGVPNNLMAVRADEGPAIAVQSVEGLEGTSISFAPGRVLVVTTVDERDESGARPEDGVWESTLRAFDADSLEQIGEIRMSGTLLLMGQSSSRRWALASTFGPDGASSFLVDLDRLEVHDITATAPSGPVFGHQSDRVFGLVWAQDSIHLRAWDIETIVTNDFEIGEDGVWSEATLDIDFGDGELGWTTISPTDDTALVDAELEVPGSRLVDLATGQIRRIETGISSATYSPDGSTIVGYRSQSPYEPDEIVTVDVETAEIDTILLPFEGTPNFFVTRSGHDVVVAPLDNENQSLLLIDLSDGTSSRAGGAGVDLGHFTSRVSASELWLVDDDALYRLDLIAGDTDRVDTVGFNPFAINILPTRDLLVIRADEGVVFFDPWSREATRTVPLP